MDVKIIALDLDGTTLDKNGKLSEETKDALMAAMDNGVNVCIASGRAFDALPIAVLEVPGIEYAITSNGAAIYKVKNKELIKAYKLLADSVDLILSMSKKYKRITFECFINGTAYAQKDYIENPLIVGDNVRSVEYIRRTRHPVDNIIDFIRKNKDNLDCMNIILGDQDIRKDIIEEISSKTSDVYITSASPVMLEFSYKDCGKASGLKFLSDYLGVDRDLVAAFGDADNDIDMIKFAGIGVAMANANEALKSEADYITLSNDENGVAYALKNILEII
ncbi:Cof-type HAD-IIB family hydrolase [Lachnospira multipara]|uniref:Cof-type HAD-IIB family hydrolase n=1 Tax=Lachnospira multipara TaxID=28051 RepID=UPI0004E0DDDD|nr:Cof-type HAD-IIB family hydrolase [Lachnospira multipara]